MSAEHAYPVRARDIRFGHHLWVVAGGHQWAGPLIMSAVTGPIPFGHGERTVIRTAGGGERTYGADETVLVTTTVRDALLGDPAWADGRARADHGVYA